ncbi:hypothetical protein DL766_002738 [Monosporascus sp. MC13-8B]|uniref:Uncharacterized protein n=1 Tax=Monosporascus cannonballus TaxID=155416 RepID=A0ABY0HFF2_9PEZI|nr:hypothetical protein DL762_002811 [Monosporascus cannonballus]RYO97584.1 hypothetical protein DL763_002697 [Monosporascus cannonballus]RYP34930.1 hypothetical protein DL766_002738 [Monosporascus sp. MC13-8B]
MEAIHDICSLCLRRQRGPYISTSPCADGPPAWPTVHSHHSCGTVVTAVEKTYSGGGSRCGGGGSGSSRSGGAATGEGEANAEWKDLSAEARVVKPYRICTTHPPTLNVSSTGRLRKENASHEMGSTF